jgi:glycosyltransferase involved in cell wall biosynthesis
VPTAHKIYINGKFLCQQPTGVQKYALGISLALQKKHSEIIVLVPRNVHKFHGLHVKQIKGGKGFFWEQFCLPMFLLFHPHSLLLNFCNTAPLVVKKQIVTIHDLAFLRDKNWFSPTFRRWYGFLIPRLCIRSIKIITVSEFIKREINKKYGINQEKIKIVPNGIPVIEFDEQNALPFKYLLLTGVYNPRKNAGFVLSQLPEIVKRGYHIIGVGTDAGIYGKYKTVKDADLHLLRYVEDKQYYTLLKHAEALIFPSEYEGFGIPVLEAFMLGTPVIAPDTPVYRESFGNLPLYYPSGNANAFLQLLDKLNIYLPEENELLQLKNKYNFDRSAEIIAGIINQYQQK